MLKKLCTGVLLLFLLFLKGLVLSQTTKGVVESSESAVNSNVTGEAYALIVGVSNYPYVKPLNFAEEDALLFFEFLQSNAGGNVPKNHIKLLLNDQATHANVTAGLAWLNNSVGAQPKPGDRVYIYLSGHGDAYDASEAYYLCYDSNPAGDKNNYQLGGALDIGKMKKRVAAMVSKGVEVVLIVDACRSGDVPGVRSGIGNPYQSVIEEPVGEVLLLSAGPNQFALEDRRWGGGHGGFTWYLMKGLSGEADSDGDGSVSLFEIESYTKMKVIGDTKQMGAAQTPYVCCNGKFDCVLSKKDDSFKQRIRSEESGNTKVGLTALAARDALEKAMFENEALKQEYFAMKKACKVQNYLGEKSAWSIWENCKATYTSQEVEPLRMYLMGALAAEGQKAINQEMNVSLGESPGYEYYQLRREWLERAKSLQREKGEVAGIDVNYEFLKALELSHSVAYAMVTLDSVIYVTSAGRFSGKTIKPYDQADSIFANLKKDFSKNAVFYYLVQDHHQREMMWQLSTKNTERKKNIQQAMELAPDWAKPLWAAINMNLYSANEVLEKIETKIQENPTNADFYLIAANAAKGRLPIDRKKMADCLLKAFQLRKEESTYSIWLSSVFMHQNFNGMELMNIMESEIYPIESEEWKLIKSVTDQYFDVLSSSERSGNDATNLVHEYIMVLSQFATRTGHERELIQWVETDYKLQQTFYTTLMRSILFKYVENNDSIEAVLDEEAIALMETEMYMPILQMLKLSKTSYSEKQLKTAIYHFYRYLIVSTLGKDDWVEKEFNKWKSDVLWMPEIKELNSTYYCISGRRLDKNLTGMQKLNIILDNYRRIDLKDEIDQLLSYGFYLGQFDSLINIMNQDEELMEYGAYNPNLSVCSLLMKNADISNVDSLDLVLKEAVALLPKGDLKIKLASLLMCSKVYKSYYLTNTFKELYSNPQQEVERVVHIQVLLQWEMWEELRNQLMKFDWSNPGEMNHNIVGTLLDEIGKVDDPATWAFAMNLMIPYVYNASNADYSLPQEMVMKYLFKRNKRRESLYKSKEFLEVYQKFVLN